MKYVISAAMLAGLAMPAIAADPTKKDVDPEAAFCFQIEIEGKAVGTFREVEGLESNVETVEYQDGDDNFLRKRPGRAKFGDISIRRGNTLNTELKEWWDKLRQGNYDRKSLDVALRDDCVPPVIYTNFPAKWSISGTVDSKSDDVLTEEITMTVEEMSFN